MAGPCGHGGIHGSLPDGADSARDATALILAILRGDEEGQQAILGNADLQSLVHLLASIAAAMIAGAAGADPDAPPGALTTGELHAVEAILVTGITGPDDELGSCG